MITIKVKVKRWDNLLLTPNIIANCHFSVYQIINTKNTINKEKTVQNTFLEDKNVIKFF